MTLKCRPKSIEAILLTYSNPFLNLKFLSQIVQVTLKSRSRSPEVNHSHMCHIVLPDFKFDFSSTNGTLDNDNYVSDLAK